MVRVHDTIRAPRPAGENGAALPPAEEWLPARAEAFLGRTLSPAELAAYERLVRYWVVRLPPGEAMSLEGVLHLMRENLRDWNEFTHEEFRAHASGLSRSGHRKALRNLETKGLVRTRRRPGRPNAYTINLPVPKEKGDAAPEGASAADVRA